MSGSVIWGSTVVLTDCLLLVLGDEENLGKRSDPTADFVFAHHPMFLLEHLK